jgi:hypothetical protein
VEWGRLQILTGPLISRETIGGRTGFLNQGEAVIAGNPGYTIAFYSPWGNDESIEVSCIAQRGNHATARAHLQSIVESIVPLSL